MAMAMAIASQRCLYEILGIERTSTTEEIRAAYRKLALKLHPDKLKLSERDKVEEATARFQEVVHAYEVLSDPSERSWYDSHRSQILFSSSSSSSAKYLDSDIDLWPFFRPCAFSGLGDTGKGFYKVYGDLFDKIFKGEVAYAHAMRVEVGSVQEAPLMGNLESPYEQVSAFYSYWLGFSTLKDFFWLDEYRTSAAPNRKVRRLMQEENQKIRKLARREFNDTVRTLAEFVRKRDKRVLDKLVEKKKELQLKATQASLRRKQLEKERRDKAMQFEEQEWAKVADPLNDDYDDNWYVDNDTKASDSNQEFYCIICSKKFKSDKQWKNHEQSKKHKERVVELRNSFADEDNIGLESDNLEQLADDGELDIGSLSVVDGHKTEKEAQADETPNLRVQTSHFEDSVEDRGKDMSASNKTEEEHIGNNNSSHDKTTWPSTVDDKNASNADISCYDEDHESDSNQTDDEDRVLKEMLKTHTTKKSGTNVNDTENHDINSIYHRNEEHPNSRKDTGFESRISNLSHQDTDEESRSDMGSSSRPAQNQGSRKIEGEKRKLVSGSVKRPTEDTVEVNRIIQHQEVEHYLIAERQDMLHVDKEASLNTAAKQSIDRKSTMATTLARNAQSKNNKKSKGKKGKSVGKLEAYTCGTCGEDFGSRNQLFSHLQVTNHAILKAR